MSIETSPADEVSLEIAAPPAKIWAIVTDPAAMGELSPECTGGEWLGGATGPVAGASFKGFNRRGKAKWSTTNKVVTADAEREFAFETKQSGTRWRYRLEPAGGGTLVTESREPWRERPLVARIYAKFMLGGVAEHEDEMREGMAATLQRLKAVAERP